MNNMLEEHRKVLEAASILIKISNSQADTDESASRFPIIRYRRSNPLPMIERNVHGRRPQNQMIERNVHGQRHHDQLPRMGSELRRLVEKNSLGSSYWWKDLTKSDELNSHGRLRFTGDFSGRICSMLKEGEDPRTGIPVTVYYDDLREFTMQYKCWAHDYKKFYVLTSGWNEFRTECRLKEDQTIYVWAFRNVSSKNLCFAISTVRP